MNGLERPTFDLASTLLRMCLIQFTLGCGASEVPPDLDVGANAEALSEVECNLLATYANDLKHDDILGRLNETLTGMSIAAGIREGKEIRVQGVQAMTFTGCRVDLTLDVRFRRPGIRQDAYGTIGVAGDLYPARRAVQLDEITDGVKTDEFWIVEELVCLRNMDVNDVDLSHLSDSIGEQLAERFADKRVDEMCRNAGAVWQDIQNELNALPLAPQIPFEWLPDDHRNTNYPIGTQLCGGGPCAPTVVACATMDEQGNCGPCVVSGETCVPCFWNSVGQCELYPLQPSF